MHRKVDPMVGVQVRRVASVLWCALIVVACNQGSSSSDGRATGGTAGAQARGGAGGGTATGGSAGGAGKGSGGGGGTATGGSATGGAAGGPGKGGAGGAAGGAGKAGGGGAGAGGKGAGGSAGAGATGSPDASTDAHARRDAGVDWPATDGPGGGATDAGPGVRCASVRLGATRATRDAILVDVDGDGRLDIVTAETDGHTAIFRQNGWRSFAAPLAYEIDAPSGLYEEAVAAADLNEDGIVDFAAADGYGRVGLVLSGIGGWTTTAITDPVSNDVPDIAVADFDGNGHLDIVTPLYDSTNVAFRWATGPAMFSPRANQPSCNQPDRLIAFDANEDKRPDLFVGCIGGASQVWINSGNRTFTTTTLYDTFKLETAAVGDLNHDGHADLVMPDVRFSRVIVELGDGKGGFSAPTGLETTTKANPQAAVLGDFDHDGNVDLLLGHASDLNVMFYAGTGDGHFQSGQAIPTSWNVITFAAADIDGDGIDDFVATNWGHGLTVYFGPCP